MERAKDNFFFVTEYYKLYGRRKKSYYNEN